MSDELARVTWACREAGCRLYAAVNHGGAHTYRVSAPNMAAKLRLLDALATWDSRDPEVMREARSIAGDCFGDMTETLFAIHEYVRDGVAFIDEPTETFQHTMQTLTWQVGDCDCTALALCALLRSLGYLCRFQTLFEPPTHVAVQVYWGDEWNWLETSLRAEPGEHPLDARDRLGPENRPDLQGRFA